VATDDTPQQNQTKYDEEAKLRASLDCSDLKAQWAMADVTFWAFWAGIAGIGLVFLTWMATRRAARITEDAARDQLRAYLSIKCSVSTGAIEDEPLGTQVWIEVENVGQSPAFNVMVFGTPFTNESKTARAENTKPRTSKIICGYLVQKSKPAKGYVTVKGVETNIIDGGVKVDGARFIIADGFVEFDDIYTVNNKSLPKRRVGFHRYGKTIMLWERGVEIKEDTQMYSNHQYESAT